MRVPTTASSAGSSVTDAAIMTSTVSDVAIARPCSGRSPMTSNPSSEMTTVLPAIRTERPAVVIVSVSAAALSAPAPSAVR
jgi:hypothetical protein